MVPLLTFIFAVQNRAARRYLLVALIVSILALQSLLLHDSPRASLSILGYLQFFLIGFLLADVFLSDWNEAPAKCRYWDVAAVIGWPLLFVILRFPQFAHWLFPGMILLLYCATFRGNMGNRIFVNPWITAIGGMCYSIYLLHYEVISAVARFTKRITEGVPYWLHLTIQFVLVGAAIILLCGIYFVLLEKPCMRRDWPNSTIASSRNSVISRRRRAGHWSSGSRKRMTCSPRKNT